MQAKGLISELFPGEATSRKQREKEDAGTFPSPSMFLASSQPPSFLPHTFPSSFLLNHTNLLLLPCSPPTTSLFCFLLLCGSQSFPFPSLNTTLQARSLPPLSPQDTLDDRSA